MSKSSPSTNSILSYINQVFGFSLPIIANNLIGIVPSLCSMWFLSRLGKEQLAAATLASSSFYTIVTLFVTGFYALGIKISHSVGSQNKDHVAVWVRNGFLLAILFAIPAILILLSLPSFLLLIDQDPKLVTIAAPFFQFGALAIIMMLLNTALNQYFSGIGYPRIAFILSIITLPLIVTLSYILVLGKCGFHQYGLGGINLASFIIDSLVFVIGMIILFSTSWSKPYKVFASWEGLSLARCKDLFKLGWPISLQISGELLALTCMVYLLGLFGVSALAAGQIVNQFVLTFVMITIGLSQGVSILVSKALGAQDFVTLKKLSEAGQIIILIISFCFAFAFIGFPTQLIDLYLDISHPSHSMVVHLGTEFLEIAAVYSLFDGFRNILTSTLRGMQDAKVPMQIGLVSLWFVGIPLALITGFVFPQGATALRCGFTIGVITGTIWLWCRYQKRLCALLGIA